MEIGAGTLAQSPCYPFGHIASLHWGNLKPKEDRSVGPCQLMEQWDGAADVGLWSPAPVSPPSDCTGGFFSLLTPTVWGLFQYHVNSPPPARCPATQFWH